MSMKFIKKLSDEVSLVGQYIESGGLPALWNLRLVSTSPTAPKAQADYSEGDLPSRETLKLGGFTATTRVDINLNRYYRCEEDASGGVVFKESLTS